MKEAFEIPPEEISPCRFPFMSVELANAREKKELLKSLALTLSSYSVVKHVHFIKGYRVNKIPDLAQS